MAVARQFNFLGQARVDVPHLRLVESAIAGDFDALAGKIIAGQQPGIVSGFNISTTNAYGAQAKALKVVVAGAGILHYGASESGTVFTVASGTSPEILDPSLNSKVIGSFAAGATNYVGLDLVRTVNDATADLVQFLSANTLQETAKTVPLARTLVYRFVISTKTFSSAANIAPLAIVAVDATGNVTSITDARKMLFRLGSGGDVPNALNTYIAWGTTAGSRKENPLTSNSADPFAGGDKGLASFKDWMNGVMTRMWEIGGGEYWYSPTADRDIILTRSGSVLANGDYFKWDGTDLTWQGLSFIFSNSTGTTNQVKDQAVALPGTTNLSVGDCVFVDLDRTQNLTGGSALVAVKGSIAAVGQGARPGSRTVLAWRTSTGVFARGLPYPVGTISPPASTTGLGVVKLASAYTPDASQPEVPTMDASSSGGTLAKVLAGGLTRGTTTAGNLTIGGGANDNTVNLGRVGQTTAILGIGTAASSFSAGSLLSQVLDSNAAAALVFKINGAARWQIASTGELQAQGANRAIQNVLDPANPQDAATRNYVDTTAAQRHIAFLGLDGADFVQSEPALTSNTATKVTPFAIHKEVGTAVTSNNTDKLTIGVNGTYRIRASISVVNVAFAATWTAGSMQLKLYKNGSIMMGLGQQSSPSGTNCGGLNVSGEWVGDLVATDFIELYAHPSTFTVSGISVIWANLTVEKIA